MMVAVMRHSEMDRKLAKVLRKKMAVKVDDGTFTQHGRLTKRDWRPDFDVATYTFALC